MKTLENQTQIENNPSNLKKKIAKYTARAIIGGALTVGIAGAGFWAHWEYCEKPKVQKAFRDALRTEVTNPVINFCTQSARIANDPLMTPIILEDYKTSTETQELLPTNPNYSK